MGNSSTDDYATTGDGSCGDTPPLNSSIYSEGEKVLAYHGKRIYDAKVQKLELRNNKWIYFVHYLGWNKVWDEWVGVDRLLKQNEENIIRQQTLAKQPCVDDNTKSGQLTQMNPKSSAVGKERKRKNDSGTEDTVSLETIVKNQVPSIVRRQVIDNPDFVSQQDKGLLGMDAGSSSQINEKSKRASRRVWTNEEEDALLGILEDLVANGHRVNRAFIPGTMTIIENALRNLCPGSALKANPHIESKIKKLKKQFRLVYDMVNNTGFGWNKVKKCVRVDSEETWKAYLQHHKEAYGWKGKHFPIYDRLVKIFIVDYVNEKTSQTPAEIIEEVNCGEDNSLGMEEDTRPRSPDQISTTKQTDQSHSSKGKRRRQDDTADSSQIVEKKKKGSRRVWTKEEEEALLSILEDLVAKGHRENRTFKAGTLTLIEKGLCSLCPASGLKASPHVESKMKILKKQHCIIDDMLNQNGFGWNDLKKCVEVDSEETWKAYVQHHREADGWRGKYFPLYDRLVNIFGEGRANVKPSQALVERVEEINCVGGMNRDEEINCEEESTDSGSEEDTLSRSVDQISTNRQTDQSDSLLQRNRCEHNGVAVALENVPASVVETIKTSNEPMRVSVESKGNKIDELHCEIKRLGLSVPGRVKALRLLVTNSSNADIFLTLDDEEKAEFVKQLLDESSNKK
nr:uncharacterized protein LOC103425109 isoform X2 [Malus domestica]